MLPAVAGWYRSQFRARCFQTFSHKQRRHTAGELDHLDPPLHVASRLDQGLSMLSRVATDQFLEIFFEQHLELEEDPRALDRRRLHPGGECCGGGFDCGIDVLSATHGRFGNEFSCGWIENRGSRDRIHFLPLAANEEGTGDEVGWAGNLHIGFWCSLVDGLSGKKFGCYRLP